MAKRERVILIKGDSTKWYDQAIFIVNRNMPQERIPVDFVAEAESIINNYVTKKGGQPAGLSGHSGYASPVVPAYTPKAYKKPQKNRRFDLVLNAVMALGCLAIAIVFILGMMT